jgi:RNA polymerase sigma-70 factor (ECF subfamily)
MIIPYVYSKAVVLSPLICLLFAVTASGQEALAEKLRRRDPDALAKLYDQYGRAVYGLIHRVVHDQGIAEDLVQETFLRVWNRSSHFDAVRGSLVTWILTIARNQAIDYLRSADARMARMQTELDALEQHALFVDVERELLNTDRVRRVREAFGRLSPNQRLVLELAYFEGLSQSEMALRTKQPLGTIKTWVRGALQILRDELGQVVQA